MPRNKDLKRLVRGRMSKTGESYTAARAVLVSRDGTSQDSPYAGPRKDWPKLAGVRDEVVKEKTGRSWAQWVAALDARDAYRLSHRDLGRLVATEFDVAMWWTQAVTVGYERIRGLREVGQGRDGWYTAGKSRTVAVGVSTLFAMSKNARRRARWLPDGPAKVRTAITDKAIRFDWNDGTQVNLYFTPKGPSKATITVEHAKLSNKAAVAAAKAFWDERLNALAAVLRNSART
jgi:hypothetical protein